MANIYRRGKTWWGRAQRDNKELRRSLKTRDRHIAERRLRTWLDELDATNWGGRARISFSVATRQFILERLPERKETSAKRYGVSLKWLSDKFGAMTLDQITRGELSAFEIWRRAMGASNPTIRRDLSCLSAVFTFAEDKEWIDEGNNPVPGFLRRGVKRGLKESPGRRRYLSEEEEAALLAAAGPRLRDSMIVAIDTGLRWSEQMSLTWPQIDFRRGIIRTSQDTKSGRSRTVPMPARSAQLLAQKRAQGIQSLIVFGVVSHQTAFNAAKKRAGIEDLRWHDLRRTAGCRWLQRDGLSLSAVRDLLGHESIKTTEKSYAFLDLENLAESVARTKTGTELSGLPRNNKA